MARVFTTSLEFNHRLYDAIVTVLDADKDLTFQVRLLDKDLHTVFPDGQVRLGSEALQPGTEPSGDQVSKGILKKIGEAIEKHLVSH